MKKIAVITGASSGMGRRFAETVDSFGRFDEVWVIARHQKALKELREIHGSYDGEIAQVMEVSKQAIRDILDPRMRTQS